MKILRVISSVNSTKGGPINGLLNSSQVLLKKGVEIDIATFDEMGVDAPRDLDVKCYFFQSVLGTFSYSRSLSSWLDQNVSNYDAVIIHGIWQYHSYITAKTCCKHKVPYALFIHGMLDPWFNQQSLLKKWKKTAYWSLMEQYTVNRAGAVLFTTTEECRLARLSFSPYDPKERVVSYGSPPAPKNASGLSSRFFEVFPELKAKRIILFLGRIHEKKGIDMLINSLSSVSLPDDYILAIAGPDSCGLKSLLSSQIDRLGLADRIAWLGMLRGDTKWGAYYASEVFILPSHQENFGISVAEALSTATPVLITDKVNIWQEVSHAGAGFVEEDSEQGVENLIKCWLELGDVGRKSMSDAALLCYEERFSINSAAEDLMDVLDELAMRRGRDETKI